MIEAIVGGFTVVSILSGSAYRFVVVPIREEAREAMAKAESAEETATSAQDDIDDLTNLLVNGDSDAHNGILVDLQETVESIEENQRANRRMNNETAVAIDDLKRAVNNSDSDVTVPDRSDDLFRGSGPRERSGGDG